jgi:organic radical activating enzyme
LKKSQLFLALDKCFKNIIPLKCHHFLTPLKKKIAPYFAKTLSSIWCVTWQCNFACPYCWQLEEPQTYKSNNVISYREWLDVWKSISQHFDVITISITGGEPFLFKDFIKLLTELPDNITYDITSNLSLLNAEEFLSHEKIRKHCSGISCSFHPSNASNSKNYTDTFFEKVRKLTVLPSTKVNFVPAVLNLRFYETLNEFCRKNRIALHVKKPIVLKNPIDNVPEEEGIANGIDSSDSRLFNKSNMHEKVSCSAGLSHLALFPNADVWPCYTKAALGENYLGNLLSGEFKFNTEYMDCSYYPSCWRVDYHNVNIARKKTI